MPLIYKETGMKEQFEQRFEEELQKISQGLDKKNTVKQLEIINRRIGRLQQKYPSVSQYYTIEIESDDKTGKATQLRWKKDEQKQAQIQEKLGVYFIRTNMSVEQETTLWTMYTTLSEK
jgi:ribosomal protein L44E